MSEQKSILLLANDLMLSSTVSGHAAAQGISFAGVSAADVATRISADCKLLLLIDLEAPGLNIQYLGDLLPAEVIENAVAYGPHVHTDKLNAATEAGIGTIMSRGQFSAQVGQLIQRFAANE